MSKPNYDTRKKAADDLARDIKESSRNKDGSRMTAEQAQKAAGEVARRAGSQPRS